MRYGTPWTHVKTAQRSILRGHWTPSSSFRSIKHSITTMVYLTKNGKKMVMENNYCGMHFTKKPSKLQSFCENMHNHQRALKITAD
jgi:hypothetical protein